MNTELTDIMDVGAAPVSPQYQPSCLSQVAKQRFTWHEGPPNWLNDWLDVVFIHYKADPIALQAQVPYELALFDGRAFVSLVAFTMRRLRLRIAGRLVGWGRSPLTNHSFLNVRTYVTHDGEPGIYFLAEWLPGCVNAFLGQRTYGLPLRVGRLDYQNSRDEGAVRGEVRGAKETGALRYHAAMAAATPGRRCVEGTLEEFLLERYTAYTWQRGVRRRFRVWHEPWNVESIDLTIDDSSLIASTGDWFASASQIGAHHSEGAYDVWMSGPRCIEGPGCDQRWPHETRSENGGRV